MQIHRPFSVEFELDELNGKLVLVIYILNICSVTAQANKTYTAINGIYCQFVFIMDWKQFHPVLCCVTFRIP